jgi:hypothetical protein
MLYECESSDELIEIGMPKMVARVFYKNILEWKENGVDNKIITINQVIDETTTIN